MMPMQHALRRRMMISSGGGEGGGFASLAPAAGVTYTSGLDGLTAAEISAMAALISNEPTITYEAVTVYVDYGEIHRRIDVGNNAVLTIDDSEEEFDVVGFNHYPLAESNAYGWQTATGQAGLVFQKNECFKTTYKMNSTATNANGWRVSAMRTTTIPTYLEAISADWQDVIKPVKTKSGMGGSTTGVEIVTDSLFLPAEVEVFGTTQYSVEGEGQRYAYYAAGNSAKKSAPSVLSGTTWWLRSPRINNSSYFCTVNTSGAIANTNANSSNRIAPCFCV